MATMEQKAPSVGASKATVHKNFIGGEWVESHTGRTFENLNPADTRDVVGVFQRSDAEDVNRAIDAASEAYKKWRLVPAPRRAEMLYKASEILIGRKEEYAQLMTREMGKVIKETRGDVQEAIDCGYYTAGRRPPPVRPDRAVGVAQQVRHGRAPAAGRLRHDHAVELSHGDSLRGSSSPRWLPATPP